MSSSVRELLQQAADRLTDSDSSRLDAELLLASVLGKPRAFLYTWPEHKPTGEQLHDFASRLDRRADGYPVAYLLGKREFWGLELEVNEHVLIPRPDTERLVEVVLEACRQDTLSVVDLGTGSGAIALALASERPAWTVLATDNSVEALDCARHNRDRLGLENVTMTVSHWCEQLPDQSFQVVVSNPPYIDPEDTHLRQGDLRFEPARALVAEQDGLADIMAITAQARRILTSEGKLFLEHGYGQAAAVRTILQSAGYEQVHTWQDLNGLDRVTGGQLSA